MCSTSKLLTAAAILSWVERGELRLDRRVPFGPADLLEYAPITRAHAGVGAMTVGDLCAAAIQWSDNTAANLLLPLIGGPSGWTAYVRSIGDTASRLDRTEPAMNAATPGDPRDTTTPLAMLGDLDTLLLGGGALTAASSARLRAWLLGSRVTGHLLAAGVPLGWRVGDKSGAGDNGTRNDVGILLRPAGAPILIVVFLTGAAGGRGSQDAVIAEVGRTVVAAFGS